MKGLKILTIVLIGLGFNRDLWGYIYSGYKRNSNPTYYFYMGFDYWIGIGVGHTLSGAWSYVNKGAKVWNDVSDCNFELKHGGFRPNWERFGSI
ncbi:MAG: hypothetical protein AB1630_05650 [bacterium]